MSKITAVGRLCSWLLIRVGLLGFLLPLLVSFRFFETSVQPATTLQSGSSIFLPLLSMPSSLPPKGQHAWSSPIAVSPLDGMVWVANPDAGSVTALNPDTRAIHAEIPTGEEPWSLAIAPDGRTVYVVNTANGVLVFIDVETRRVEMTLEIGPEPAGIVLGPGGDMAYISVMAADEVAVVDLKSRSVLRRIPTAAKPYALAVSNPDPSVGNPPRLYVTHLLGLTRAAGREATHAGREGVVTVIDVSNHSVLREIVIPPNENGAPNLLAGISLSEGRAWLPHVRAAPALPLGLTTTVFAAVSALDLNEEQEDQAAYLPLNDQDIFGSPVNNPVVAFPSPDGDRLYVVLAGSNLVEVIDVSSLTAPRLVRFLATGHNPRGMALSADGRWGYVMNFLSRSITILDLDRLQPVAEIAVTGETLPADILRGKILFNNASDPRLSQGSWISCASCHAVGLPDGVTWFFPDGPRQTPALWNAGDTLPWHWSAALDEPQDVEDTIQVIQHGLGLAPGIDPPLLGAPLAGRSADLDALAVYLTDGIRPVNVPASNEAETAPGRELFIGQRCAECHGGPHWTNSALPSAPGTLDPNGRGVIESVLHDVGTLNPDDVRGAEGFDTPSLLGVALTAPYLHDGSMPTLEALLTSGHPAPHQEPQLTEQEISDLVIFMRSIGPATVPISGPALIDESSIHQQSIQQEKEK